MSKKIIIVKSPKKLNNIIQKFKSKRKKIGLVPTMGALHKGHISLINKARKENDVVIVSIFVNPTQFAPNEDYNSYPRTFKQDKIKCVESGVDIIFLPAVNSIYPDGYKTYVEVKEMSDLLCGKFRPGHFKGVATIVLKLFNITMPDTAYFGLKDYQQYIIIKKLSEDLNLNIKIRGCPIIREKDGLAMSSRNKYLNKTERNDAVLLYKSLITARNLVLYQKIKDASLLKKEIKKILLKGKSIKSSNIDYIAVINPKTLQEVKKINNDVVIALAVYVGKARLIDNIYVRKRDKG